MASNAVDVYVKLPTGRTTSVCLAPSSAVREISRHVGREEGVPGDRVVLKYQGKALVSHKTVGQYGIRPETILKAEVVVPRTIQVYVKLPDGRSVPVSVQSTDPFSVVLSNLSETEELDLSSFNYHSGEKRLVADQPLFLQGVSEESTISAREKPKKISQDTSPNDVEEPSDDIKDAVLSSFATEGRNVEVVFSFDTTGSMASYLSKVRENLQETCRRLLHDIPNIRIGLIAHGDYCDHHTYVIRQMDLTSDVQQLVDFANDTPGTCGGDSPECYEWMLHKAKSMDWSEDSAKALVVIGDAPPHPPSYTDQNINWWDEVELLKGMGVKIPPCLTPTLNQRALLFAPNGPTPRVTVSLDPSSRSEGPAKHFYEEIAEQTGGCFLHLNHFNLITQMFLAVCYNESGEDQLDAFTEELEKEGKLSEDTKVLMKEITEKKTTEEKKTDKSKNVKTKYSYEWWDVTMRSQKAPSYIYDAEKDSWSDACVSSFHRNSYAATESTSASTSYSRKTTHKKIGCEIM